jgi:hypothetical protein
MAMPLINLLFKSKHKLLESYFKIIVHIFITLIVYFLRNKWHQNKKMTILQNKDALESTPTDYLE